MSAPGALAAVAPEIADLLIEVGAVLLVLGILGGFARRYGLSPVPLYLLAGLVLGEGSAVSLDASTGFLAVGAEIGLILLLLTLGWSSRPTSSKASCAVMFRPARWTWS